MTTASDDLIKPWYRQFWPWFLISLPLATVIAGIATVIIAFNHRDPLVVDNYYKEGMGINRVIHSQRHAAELGLQAQASFSQDTGILQLLFPENLKVDSQIKLLLIHATKQDFDRGFLLHKDANNRFSLNLKNIQAGRWNMILQPTDKSWRLDANIVLPAKSWIFKPDV